MHTSRACKLPSLFVSWFPLCCNASFASFKAATPSSCLSAAEVTGFKVTSASCLTMFVCLGTFVCVTMFVSDHVCVSEHVCVCVFSFAAATP